MTARINGVVSCDLRRLLRRVVPSFAVLRITIPTFGVGRRPLRDRDGKPEEEVMYTYIMQRTQISLTTDERRVLDNEAARTGKSISALIREAVERAYGTSRSSSEELTLMRQTFGSWS